MEKYLMPMSNKIAGNRYVIGARGFMMSMPVLIVGSLCIIIADFPSPAYQDFMTGVFGDAWSTWCWDIVFPATIGLVALISLIGIPYNLAKELDIPVLPPITLSLTAYFLLIPVVDGGFSTDDFSASSLFLAMIVAIFVTEIYHHMLKSKWTIKMPSSVPSFVSNQFEALTPATLVLIIFLGIRFIFAATSFHTASDFIFQMLQKPLTNVGTSLPGTLIANFFNSFLWLFGIHGTNVVSSVFNPMWASAALDNLTAYKAGETLKYIVTMDYTNFFMFLGGTGLTLPLCFIMMFGCKSKRIKSVGKIAVLPGIFNVNEPIIFGLPIVLNPIMIIPFFLAPIVSILVSYAAMYFGIVPYPTGVSIPWTTPAPIGGWLMTGSWLGGALQLVVLFLAGIIYYPFIKMLDNKYLAEEEAADSEANKEVIE